MTKSDPSLYALDVSRFADSPAYELAVVVHRETEAQRAIEARTFKAEHGDVPWPRTILQALTGPYDRSAEKPWSEYANDFHVLERCRVALGVSTLGVIAERIRVELHPENWEVFFWMAAWLQEVDVTGNLQARMHKLTQAIEREREKQRRDRADGGFAKHQKTAKAKAFVLREWALHKDAYAGNRTAFATDYARRIKNEMVIDVAVKTIAVNWLGRL
jgi:hypothetical protein